MSHHQHQLDHHTHSFRSSQQYYLVHQELRQQMAALHQRRASFSSTRLQPTSTLFVDLDNKFQHIPAQHRISGSTLVAEFNSSSGPGNFAKHLIEKLFPELFTEECLHRFYSYNGDKKNNKNQLDPSRIQPLREYVTHFFSEVIQPQAWKLMVIPKINDALQRPKPLQKTQI